MGEKLFIYRYKEKPTGGRSRKNASLKWTFLSIIIFFIILALVPVFKKKKEVEKGKVLFEVPGKNVLIKKVPLPETMTPSGTTTEKSSKRARDSGITSREKKLDALYTNSKTGKSKTVKSDHGLPVVSVRKAGKSTYGKEAGASKSTAGSTRVVHSAKKTLYVVQVGAFRNEKNALKLVAKLRKKGYRVFLSPEKHGEIGLMYHVGLDPVENRSEAARLKEKLAKEEGIRGAYIRVERR